MDHPRFSEITDETIVVLVDTFYDAVRADERLAPVFNGMIAADAWPAHLERMYAFWSSVMLTSGRYKGNPVAVHRQVSGIDPSLFPHWLDLFETTADRLFVAALADEFAVRAARIAESLRLALFFRPSEPWPDDLRNRPRPARCA